MIKAEEINVLVVDDDAQARSIIVEYLESFGFKKIIQFGNGDSAIKYVQDVNKPVDIVLSDWEMPQGNGLQLLKAVRLNPKRKGIQFMMITSQRSQERFKITQAAHWRVDAYLIKPFRGHVLQEKMELLLKRLSGVAEAS
jgi:two-component system chemotaxis response regulator CheY